MISPDEVDKQRRESIAPQVEGLEKSIDPLLISNNGYLQFSTDQIPLLIIDAVCNKYKYAGWNVRIESKSIVFSGRSPEPNYDPRDLRGYYRD